MATRTYNSPLREEQTAQTRVRILEQVTEILAEPGAELSVAEAANRARVSVRTAYRYFPTKEALVDAFNEWSGRQYGFTGAPKSLDDMVEFAKQMGGTFAANEPLLRATQRTAAADEVRRRRKLYQSRAVMRLVDEAAPGVDPVIRKQAAAAILLAMSFDAWLQYRDIWALDADQAIASMQWNVTALITQLYKAAPKRR